MPSREDLTPEAHQRLLALHGSAEAAFAALAGKCVRRFLEQTGQAPLSDTFLTQYAARLWQVVNEAGLPPPLAGDDSGEPGEMPAERAAELAAQVFAGLPLQERHVELDVPTRQLLKACLQPEFRQCRESYHEVVDGACRRQQLKRVRARISGAHCVDCPYWVSLRSDQHRALLAKSWVSGDPAEFEQHAAIYLPEDFRALRVFVWQEIHVA
jgi:hypothetical protein